MARGQRSKIRQRRRAPLRAKYEERQRQALIIKHQLLSIKKANESKVMEVTTPQQTEVTSENSTEKSTSVHTTEVANNKPSKSKLKKMREARKRKKLGIKKGRWKWT